MANTAYIQFPDIIGGSKDRVHLGWLEVNSWSIDNSGIPLIFIFSLTDYAGTPKVQEYTASGRHFDKVTFDATRADGSLYLRYMFEDAVLRLFQDNTISFEFASLEQVHFDPLAHESVHGRD